MPGLIAALEQANPCSKYLDVVYGPYLVAVSKAGGAAKVPAIAEKALANFPDNEDLLLVMVESSMSRKQTDRALTYANKLTAVLANHPKPETLSAADWERKRNAGLARGYWVAGVIYGEKGNYAAADKKLRSALPLVKGNDAMTGPALFYLGMANYQLGKMTLNKALVLEAAKFSEQSAALEGAYAEQARHNAIVMKADAGKMR
jgi:tetratricopeptide (TPR) repeat protein